MSLWDERISDRGGNCVGFPCGPLFHCVVHQFYCGFKVKKEDMVFLNRKNFDFYQRDRDV